MVLDGVDGEIEPPRNALVGEAGSDELEELALAGGETRGC